MKATAIAHPIQGLVKYHGLKDTALRIPFHDSISVCLDGLKTTTTVEATTSRRKDSVTINGRRAVGQDFERVQVVLSSLRSMVGYSGSFKVASENSETTGKGLGFSASGFAALGTAACAALDCDVDYVSLSEVVRLGAGSATRSLAGGFALWYANKGGRSYAEQVGGSGSVDFRMVVVPLYSSIRTDEAHGEVLSSPLFEARLKYIEHMVGIMVKAIKEGDTTTIGRLAEEDTLNLHASTMTGKAHMILWEPDTLRIIREVEKMRGEGVLTWFSIDTGPSVFINTVASSVEHVAKRLNQIGFAKVIRSKVGNKPRLINRHLF